MGNIDGIILTPLKVINTPGGNVLHAMKYTDDSYAGFGEAYFSAVEPGLIKGWKRHQEMILNLIVPVGTVRFVIYDDRHNSATGGVFQEITLSKENYFRLTVPPLVWIAFQGVGRSTNLLLNIASIPHHPDEADKKRLDEFDFEWRPE